MNLWNLLILSSYIHKAQFFVVTHKLYKKKPWLSSQLFGFCTTFLKAWTWPPGFLLEQEVLRVIWMRRWHGILSVKLVNKVHSQVAKSQNPVALTNYTNSTRILIKKSKKSRLLGQPGSSINFRANQCFNMEERSSSAQSHKPSDQLQPSSKNRLWGKNYNSVRVADVAVKSADKVWPRERSVTP